MKTQIKVLLLLVLTIAGVGFISHSSEEPVLPKLPDFKIYKLTNGQFRTITAYNVGDEAQTDDTPCIGAYSDIDLCQAVADGRRVCASNAYPKYSLIYIEGYGECEILDRMAEKFSQRVDIAFPLDQKAEAIEWGKKSRRVYLIK